MMRRTKVAFVSQPWEFPLADFAYGGIANWTYQVARRLAGHCDVTVYSRRRNGVAADEWDQGVRYRNLSAREFVRLLDPLWRRMPPRTPLFASTAYNLVYALKVAIDVRRWGCDVVHVHNFSQFAPVIRAFNPRAKIVLHMQCEWLTQLHPRLVLRRLGQVDLVLGCSEHVTAKIRRAFPRLAPQCRTLYNGVDVDQFSRADPARWENGRREVKRVIYAGRVSPEKGIHVLVDAFHDVVERQPNVELHILGPDAVAPPDYIVALTEDPRVKELARFYAEGYAEQLRRRLSASVAQRVVFAGARPHPELAECLRAGDLFVHPSVWDEPFAMAIVEAMAAGLPVIVSRTGGPAEYIDHGRTGWLVEPGDAGALAAGIVRLLSDDELREAIGRAGQQQARARFSWDHVAGGLLREYAALQDGSVGTSPGAIT